MKQTSERNVSSGASGVLEPSDLSRPITIKVHPKNEEGDSVRDESSRETEHERLTPPKEVDEVDEARVTCPSEHRINGGSQATSVVGGTSTDGRGTYASWWRSGKYSQAGAMSYPRSPSEIEEEEATCGYCCARLFCLVSKGNDRNGSMKSGMSKR